MRSIGKTRRALAAAISGLRNLPADVARQQAILEELETRRAEVVAKLAEVEAALADAPDWQSIGDVRDPDREWERQQNLRFALRHLEHGTLMRTPQESYRGSAISTCGSRKSAKRNRAQTALDSTIAQAHQLLGESVSS